MGFFIYVNILNLLENYKNFNIANRKISIKEFLLKYFRYQTGVASFKEKIYAVGGSDAWNCLGTVEVYEPERGEWSFSASLLTPRRGCGLAEFNRKLYAVGGSVILSNL